MIRASLIHMGVGFLFGTLILLHKGIPISTQIWRLLSHHIELIIFGWTIQLVMGVAFFILPRFSHRENRYGAVHLGWWSFYLLNGGVLLTTLAQGFVVESTVLLGRLLTLSGILAYLVMIWPRVKAFGT